MEIRLPNYIFITTKFFYLQIYGNVLFPAESKVEKMDL